MKKILIILSVILGLIAVSAGATGAKLLKNGSFKLPNFPKLAQLINFPSWPPLPTIFPRPSNSPSPSLSPLPVLCPSSLRPNLPHLPGCPPWPSSTPRPSHTPKPTPTPTPTPVDLQIDINGIVYEPLDGKTIFNGGDDMKPGDSGEETLSFHVNERACGFVKFKIKEDFENGCTEPESQDDHSCGNPGKNKGELDEAVKWLIWKDEGKIAGWQCGANPSCEEDPKEGDNILNGKEKIKSEGEIGDFDCEDNDDCEDEIIGIGALDPAEVVYYGFAWCFGKWKKGMECSGAKLDNETQTDSFMTDIIFSAEQKKDDDKKECSDDDKDDHDFEDDIDFPDWPGFPCGNLLGGSCFGEIEKFLRRD